MFVHYSPHKFQNTETIHVAFTIDDKYSIICTKQQLKTYYPEAYKKYFENE